MWLKRQGVAALPISLVAWVAAHATQRLRSNLLLYVSPLGHLGQFETSAQTLCSEMGSAKKTARIAEEKP